MYKILFFYRPLVAEAEQLSCIGLGDDRPTPQ
jgi:hypothetical protein